MYSKHLQLHEEAQVLRHLSMHAEAQRFEYMQIDTLILSVIRQILNDDHSRITVRASDVLLFFSDEVVRQSCTNRIER